MTDTPLRIRLRDILGADEMAAIQRFGIYFPNKDKDGKIVASVTQWARRGMLLLSRLNGGATAYPPTQGMWLDERGDPLSEQTIFVYSYIRNVENFVIGLPVLRQFLHEYGQKTNQGEVLIEFDDTAFWIREYDTN